MANPVIVIPADGATAASNGCPVLTKERVAVVERGVAASLQWQIRDNDGNPVDLTSLLGNDPPTPVGGSVSFRFADAISPDSGHAPLALVGYLVDAPSGTVQCDLTNRVTAVARLLAVGVGISNAGNQLVLVNNGILSVERGLFGDWSKQADGPPTLADLRMQLRDTMLENSLTDLPEFSDQEIIFCLAKPLRVWNETPPPVFQARASNFGCYRENWLKATCGELFTMAAMWYRRNRFNAAGGGIQDDSLAKAPEYDQAAQLLQQQWTQWMQLEKNRISALQFMGTFGSAYGRI